MDPMMVAQITEAARFLGAAAVGGIVGDTASDSLQRLRRWFTDREAFPSELWLDRPPDVRSLGQIDDQSMHDLERLVAAARSDLASMRVIQNMLDGNAKQLNVEVNKGTIRF